MGRPETQIGPSFKEGPIWMDGLDKMDRRSGWSSELKQPGVGGLKHKRRTHLDAPL